MPDENLHQLVRSVIRRLLHPAAVAIVAVCGLPTARAGGPPPPGPLLHSVTLTWDSDPLAEILSYRILVGLESRHYLLEFDAGLETTFPVEYLEYGRTYYFAIKAIGANGLESPLSQELVVTIAPPALPLNSRISASESSDGPPSLHWSYPQSAAGSVSEFVIYSSPDLVRWTKCDTVDGDKAVAGDSQISDYAWPIVIREPKMFFRVTAKNWMSESMTP